MVEQGNLEQAREQDAAYRRLWQTFRTFRRVADGRHDGPGWRGRSGVFAACLLRVPVSALHPDLDRLRADLAAVPILRLHPDHFLHVMLQELGFLVDEPQRRDEISPARLVEFAANAAGPVAELRPFPVTLGGANSFQDAVFLDVRDGGGLAPLHARLHEFAAVKSAPRFAYLPHATVAHYTTDAPIGRLPALLADWRDHRFGRFLAAQVEVVTIAVDEPYPPMVTRATLPLGG